MWLCPLSWTLLAIGLKDKPLLEISSIWVQKVCATNPIGNIMIQCTSTPNPLNPKHLISSREKIKVPWIPNQNARKLSKHVISEETETLSVYSLLSSRWHTRGFGYRSSRFKCNNLSHVPVQERERATSAEGKQQTPLYSLIRKCVGGDKRHTNAVLEQQFEVQIFSCNDSDLLITKTSWILQVLLDTQECRYLNIGPAIWVPRGHCWAKHMG